MDLFRANSLFRNFEIKGPADRALIVLILFISDCLQKLGSARTTPNQIEASKSLNTLSVDNFAIPGDANFPLNAHYAPPSSRADAGKFPYSYGPLLPEIHDRLPKAILDTSSTGASRASGRNTLRRWNWETEQMVDVVPEKAVHEQKSVVEDV